LRGAYIYARLTQAHLQLQAEPTIKNNKL